MHDLQISEIFYSLQGESRTLGHPTVFIRLTGCPIRCSYCDTKYAFSGGQSFSIDSILQKVATFSTKYVLVTGGEPLAQDNTIMLLSKLCDLGYEVSLETGGMLDVSKVDDRVSKILDVKTPGSNENESNLVGNYQYLTGHDQVKFVICDENDYNWAKEFVSQNMSDALYEISFSPSYGELEEVKLADWILKDQLPVRFQSQLHKSLWGDVAGR